ncbi:MAG: class I SAM-dependent methyltransferase [Acidobacteria bacterium]|nr:class I SAM-dependent methyltransferase [Acidobacteriota bacterium]
MPAPAVAAAYTFKGSPYGSHLRLLEALPLEGHGRRLLDIGCGEGYLAEMLAARGYRVTGVDCAPPSASPGFEFLLADLERGLPPLGRFDFILCADVLEHLRDPAALLRQVRLALAPGGQLLASLPNSGHAYFRWNVLLGRFPAHPHGLFDRTHLRFYTWAGWRQILTEAGFRLESVSVTGTPVGLALLRWKHSRPVLLLERVAFELGRLWKTLFGYQFIVVAA